VQNTPSDAPVVAGWYLERDGKKAYWTGTEWINPEALPRAVDLPTTTQPESAKGTTSEALNPSGRSHHQERQQHQEQERAQRGQIVRKPVVAITAGVAAVLLLSCGLVVASSESRPELDTIQDAFPAGTTRYWINAESGGWSRVIAIQRQADMILAQTEMFNDGQPSFDSGTCFDGVLTGNQAYGVEMGNFGSYITLKFVSTQDGESFRPGGDWEDAVEASAADVNAITARAGLRPFDPVSCAGTSDNARENGLIAQQ
jgi:hypothetical protein